MRKELCEALLKRVNNSKMVFLTGDLGFMALEPLQQALSSRFINAGVAEQNMVSVAAGLSIQGMEVWVYSIAPFCYARPFEQIRNDIAFHNLPVKLIGNGGGYGYGVMGPTHHAIEDYGVLLTLPNMTIYIPVFDSDMDAVISRAGRSLQPAYIRMGRGELPKDYPTPDYSPWRLLTEGDGPVVITVGPLAGLYISAFNEMPTNRRPNLWVISELPISLNPVPIELIDQVKRSKDLFVVEEHVRHGGFGSDFLLFLAEKNIQINAFHHLHAKAHHYEKYGSQNYLRLQSGLDLESLLKAIGTNES